MPTPAAEVLPLRRPSRTAPRLLAAAAAVVLLGGGGVALSQVLGHQDSRITADSAVAGSTTDGVPGPALTSAPDQAATPGTTSPEAVRGVGPQLQVVPEFTRSGFAAQAASYRVAVGTSDSVADGEGTAGSPAPAPAATTPGTAPPTAKELPAPYGADYCPGPTGTDAVIVPINLDGVPAALAVHPVVAGSQLYEAWTCDGTFRITYATVAR